MKWPERPRGGTTAPELAPLAAVSCLNGAPRVSRPLEGGSSPAERADSVPGALPWRHHGVADGALKIYLVRLHGLGRREKRQSLQISAESE